MSEAPPMERLTIARKNLTPLVDLNPDAGLLTLEGESYPENVLAFYRPILDWIRNYFDTRPTKPVVLQVSLRYLNTSSTKVFLMILDLCQKARDAGTDVRVRWIHHPEDSLIREMGEDLHDGLTLPFEFVAQREERSPQ